MKHLFFSKLLAAVAWLTVLATPVAISGTVQDLLSADVDAGLISEDEAKVLQAIAVTMPEHLPARYESMEIQPTRCATDLVRDAFLVLLENPALAFEYRGTLDARPVRHTAYMSPQGLFQLHYDTVGVDTVPSGDANINGIPDQIERAGELADSVWLYELVELGYLPPPGDGTLGGGGVDVYDIYFESMPTYGYCSPELAGPEPWDDYTSHIVVSSCFQTAPANDDPEGRIMGALKVTLAHEYFHAIQFGYNAFTASYFMEMSSTWMEEMAYPVVNDNYQYLPRFFDEPEDGLMHEGTHRYASFIWPKYLEENFGIDVMRNIWNRCKSNSAYNAMAYVLDTLGTTLGKQYAAFLTWNFLTNDRGAVGHYVDAADYPDIHIMRTHSVVPDSNYFSLEPPEALASNYIIIENPGDIEGILTFDLDADPVVNWVVGYVIDYGEDNYFDTIWTSISNGEGKVYVQYFEDVQRVVVIPGILSGYAAVHNFFYDLYIRPQGDADGNHIVNVSDVTMIIAYIFGGGLGSHPLAAMDADCNRLINVSDAVVLVRYIFAGGPAPCE